MRVLLLAACACAQPALQGEALYAHITQAIVSERGEFWAVDSSETRYNSLGELYAAKPSAAEAQAAALRFYGGRNATLLGVTGLDEEGGAPDLAHTRSLVARVLQGSGSAPAAVRCLNVGAGIGREAVGGLVPAGCATVDVMEPDPRYLAAALAAMPAAALGRAIATPAQAHDFAAAGETYDVVFLGWCSQHIPDEHLIAFLRGAVAHLKRGGVLIIKDNVSDFADAVFNDADLFVIRSAAYFRALVQLASPGLARLAVEGVPEWHRRAMFPYRAFVWAREGEWSEGRLAEFNAAAEGFYAAAEAAAAAAAESEGPEGSAQSKEL